MNDSEALSVSQAKQGKRFARNDGKLRTMDLMEDRTLRIHADSLMTVSAIVTMEIDLPKKLQLPRPCFSERQSFCNSFYRHFKNIVQICKGNLTSVDNFSVKTMFADQVALKR